MLIAPADTNNRYNNIVIQSSDRKTETFASVFLDSTANNRI